MFFMLRGLPVLLEIGLLVFCLIDIIQTPPEDCRNLGKIWWIVLLIVFPIIGGVAWLVAGRPRKVRSANTWRPGGGFAEYDRPRPVRGPDDDDDFLRSMRRADDEHEETLRRWEADLRRREAEQRQRESGEDPAG